MSPGVNAHFGAVLVGNESWGSDRDITVARNTMVGPGRFLEVREPSVVFVDDNDAPDCTEFLRVVHPGARVVMSPA